MNRLSKNEEKLKEMLNTNKFEYDPSHWHEAEKMLAAKPVGSSLKFKMIWLTLPMLIVSAAIIKWAAPKPQTLVENTTHTETSATEKQRPETQEDAYAQNNNATASVLPQPSNSNNSFGTVNNPKQTIKNNTSASTTSINTYTPKPNNTELPHQKNTKPIRSEDDRNTEDTKINPNNTTLADNDKSTEKNHSTPPSQPSNDKQSDEELNAPNTANTNAIDKKEEKKEKAKKEKTEPKQILIKNSISILAGANYSSTIQTNSTQYENTPYFGLQYQHRFSQKWQLNTGLGYSYVSANNLVKEYTQKEYSFGVTSESTKITTDRLHYLELPLLVKYSAYNTINLVAGTNFTYLLNTNNTIANNTYNALGNTNTQQTKANQYRRGINPFDIQAQFGLEYKLNNNLQLGLLANAGLLDVSKNNYYNSTVFNRNSRLQLYIKYDIFRF